MKLFKNLRKPIFNRLASVAIFALIFTSSSIFLPGCVSTSAEMQDTRTIDQLIKHLQDSGLKINQIMRNVRYQAILASDGVVMKVEDANVEFYLYNMNIDYQKKKLLKVKKQGYIMVLGNKIPAITNGHFIMLTYSENPNKVKVIRAFENFKMQ